MKSYYLKSIFWFLFAAAASYVLLTYYEKQDFFHQKQDNLTVRKFSMHVSNLKKLKFHKEYDQHTPEKLFVLENFPKTFTNRTKKLGISNKSSSVLQFRQTFLIISHLSANVIETIPGNVPLYTFTFSCMLHGSWKYVMENYKWTRNPSMANKVDLLVFYSDKLSGLDLPEDCVQLEKSVDLTSSEQSVCFKRPIREGNFSYPTLNQFSFLRDPELDDILLNYDYIMRTDPDVFLTPSFFSWKIPQPVEIIFGKGGYSTQFNRELLDKVATGELHWKRQGFMNIGSSWVVKQAKFVELCEKAAFATSYIYKNCLNTTKYPEIIPHIKIPGTGEWPYWWQPVSSMYGGDLAVQHMFTNLSEKVNHKDLILDAHSSDSRPFLEANHIHAFHTYKKFNKFEFLHSLKQFCKRGKLSKFYRTKKSLTSLGRMKPNTTIPDYVHKLAVHGAIEYFKSHGCFKIPSFR